MSYLRSKLLPLPESETVLEPWRKALLDAAERIRERGWCQGVACAGDGRVCLLGAIFDVRVPSETIDWSDYRGSPAEVAAARITAHGRCAKWNDAPERTKEDVIRALTDCARS